MCSRAGRLSQVSEALQRQFTAEDLTVDRLRELCAKFVADIRAGGFRRRALPACHGALLTAAMVWQAVTARRAGATACMACPSWQRLR